MKPGAEYERFVHEKLKRLFTEGVVRLNEKIAGKESGLEREIDVSVRLRCEGLELLYVVQCKDWASKPDINVLGELSAVMQDVGAARGFLLCSAGFYKSNYQYAKAKGIELFTIEDIESSRWHVEIQIPLIYIRKIAHFDLTLNLTATAALVELNRDRAITLDLTMSTPLRVNDSMTTVGEYLQSGAKDAHDGALLDLSKPAIDVNVLGLWIPCSHFSVTFRSEQTRFLKYLTPSEYSQIRDHVTGAVLPLHVALRELPLRIDDTFVKLPEGAPPVFPGLSLVVEEADLILTGK
jgi:hypothetical protein